METRRSREHYSHKIADTKKAKKKEEAEDRQKARSKRSNLEQLALIGQRKGKSKREATRLEMATLI